MIAPTLGYHFAGDRHVNGRGTHCLRVGEVRIDEAVAAALLAAAPPAGIEASLKATEMLAAERDAALDQWRLEVERIRYEAERAERRYRAVEPANRLVARGLEAEWEKRLRELALAEAELEGHEHRCPPPSLVEKQRQALVDLETDLERVWSTSTTTDRDRRELLRTLLEEVIVAVDRAASQAHLTMRWRSGAITEIDVSLWQTHQPAEGAAQILGVVSSTVHRWLNDGFIAGEQLTSGAPWCIRITEELRAGFIEEECKGYVPMLEATEILDVSRQTVLQRVKRGDLEAVHLCRGKRKGLRIKVIDVQQKLFEEPS
jgi:hypothetical protein